MTSRPGVPLLARAERAVLFFGVAISLAMAGGEGAALAAYSAPLTRVNIDRDRETHTPSLFYVSDEKVGARFTTSLGAGGAQYVGQKEWASGFGLQLGASVAWADVDLTLGSAGSAMRPTLGTDGFLVGGQARGYWMVWSGSSTGAVRPHALTLFANLRMVYYSVSGSGQVSARTEDVSAHFWSFSAGLGAMAELSLAPWLSICPYAWFSPGLHQESRYALGSAAPVEERTDLSLRQPVRVGLDAWIYPFEGSESHFALSAIASLLDTKDQGNRELSVVLGYSF